MCPGNGAEKRVGERMSRSDIVLVYDGQCPVCANYARMVGIRQNVGELKLVDARRDSEIMREVTAQGLDIDQGMVLKMGETLYYGADAMNALALISSRSGIFNRINYWLFRSKRLSTILYPPLRTLRNGLLKLLGRTRINNLDRQHKARF